MNMKESSAEHIYRGEVNQMWISKALFEAINEDNRRLMADMRFYKVKCELLEKENEQFLERAMTAEDSVRALTAERDWYKHAYAEQKFATVKHGRWIPVDEKEDAFDCSECDAMVQRRCDFCPGCGAIMDL